MTSELEELGTLYRSRLKELIVLKELNEELLEVTHNLLTRTIQICKRNNIPIGYETKALLSEVRRALHNIHGIPKPQSTEILHDKGSTDNVTDPQNNNFIRYTYRTIR
ncbi:MAG: hypothetical protein ACREAF_00690 [Nitrosopumilaceae archaeon]